MSASDIAASPSARAQAEDRHYRVRVARDVRIPTDVPGVSLSADLFLPVGAGTVPALVTLLPYRKDAGAGLQLGQTLRWFAGRGYASLLVDFRGTGASDGTQRPPFDPGEADDGVAAVEWAAAQAWCTGHVGMWGHSYGAIMAMRTASRCPPHLKAIIPVMGLADPEHDFVHPSGIRGCLGSLARWGTETLLSQLLPPLADRGSAAQQRWEERLHCGEPWLVDLVRHGPGDPVWRSRAVDASAVSIPSYCVAGWRDLFCDATIRAFEQINGPKKLLVGPWMHTMPDASPFDPIDFQSLALRWWDYWLSGIDTGIMDEPQVTFYVQGIPEWRQSSAWPLPYAQQWLAAADERSLRPTTPPGSPQLCTPGDMVIGEARPDPTVGSQSGLWGVPTSGFGLPLDSHDDDMRSLTFTTDPLNDLVTIAGRPIVTIRLASGSIPPSRLVARLADVDQRERSILVTAGALAVPGGPADPGVHEVALPPTCYALSAGHRLRIAIGTADFPRLWPADTPDGGKPVRLQLAGLTVSLPVLNYGSTSTARLPEPSELIEAEQGGPPALYQRPRWTVSRDLISDGITVTLGQDIAALTPDSKHMLELAHQAAATVTPGSAAGTRAYCTSTATVRMATGEAIAVHVDTQFTLTAASATGRIDIDGITVFSHQWEARMSMPDSRRSE